MATTLFLCDEDTVSRDTVTRYNALHSIFKNKVVAIYTVSTAFTYDIWQQESAMKSSQQ